MFTWIFFCLFKHFINIEGNLTLIFFFLFILLYFFIFVGVYFGLRFSFFFVYFRSLCPLFGKFFYFLVTELAMSDKLFLHIADIFPINKIIRTIRAEEIATESTVMSWSHKETELLWTALASRMLAVTDPLVTWTELAPKPLPALLLHYNIYTVRVEKILNRATRFKNNQQFLNLIPFLVYMFTLQLFCSHRHLYAKKTIVLIHIHKHKFTMLLRSMGSCCSISVSIINKYTVS